jgi:hypothetical protein
MKKSSVPPHLPAALPPLVADYAEAPVDALFGVAASPKTRARRELWRYAFCVHRGPRRTATPVGVKRETDLLLSAFSDAVDQSDSAVKNVEGQLPRLISTTRE